VATKVIDPFRMCELFWPEVKFYAKQREVLRSVRDNDETFVVAGNMLGDWPPALAW
jgi:hypothetical protein